MQDQGQSSGSSNGIGPNDWYIAHMFEQFVNDPQKVDASWRVYFTENPGIGPAALKSMEEGHLDPSTIPLTPTIEDEVIPESQASPRTPSGEAGLANYEVVTRSDLPPAPPARIKEATSPYARAHQHELRPLNGHRDLEADQTVPLRGPARAIAKNMEASLSVPTATSAREVPAKLLIENRRVINQHLGRTVGGKVSFTHLIAFALVEALAELPEMNVRYTEVDGKPNLEDLAHVGLGIAVDVPKPDGTRSLLVPVVRDADTMLFPQFVAAMDDLIARARTGELTAGDFQGASVSLTNPGTLGTTHSVPRLMPSQGVIIGIGSTSFPAEWAGVPAKRLAELGIGETMYVTSTYDHRVIQGAASGQMLRTFARKIGGEDDFYDRLFDSLRIPYSPYRWELDQVYNRESEKGKQSRITELIHAYRSRGHLAADTDPLAYRVRRHPDLELGRYGLTVWDLDRTFPTGGFGGVSQMVMRSMLERLRDTYTRTIGIEYMHIQDPAQRLWVQEQVEAPYQKPSITEQRHILNTLVHAEAFEEFLQTKFVGQKRFSLEGGESLIPLLDAILHDAAENGLNEVTIGMAHRGRLNVLANIAGKSYSQIFSEFEGSKHMRGTKGSGDVKYHLGTEGVYSADDGMAVKVYLAANPSHLEAVDGVLLGITRAKSDLLGDPTFPVMPILIHGDAAFIGQGVVSECFNMGQLDGYHTGGTIHVVVNNQIGFTTGPTQGRSTRYATDLAKGMQLPIFHVNADDPEAVVRASSLAFRYREKFNKDVIIDMVCYRRRGHNEGDDPSMTQPLMYQLIDKLPSTRAVYTQNLIGRGDISQEDADHFLQAYESELGKILAETRERGGLPEPADAEDRSLPDNYPKAHMHGLEVPESQLPGSGMMIGWTSAVSAPELERVGQAYTSYPADFVPHKKLCQLSERRLAMSKGEAPIDWGFAELLAWGTMLMDGTPVRISGQDTRRATFVQRHAVLHDQEDGTEFTPLDFLTEDQASFAIYDSPLSEYAPVAFEYGYSVERPDMFVAWEAQFGDFANGAQSVIDEFVSSAQSKWGQQSSLVMMLPHGYEGQGPDHSSSRIERYLQLAAEDNMWVAQPSTPANHFHLLRMQAYRRPRTPLIEITPKQLLRLSAASSSRDEFLTGSFQPVIGEVSPAVLAAPQEVRKVLVCTGRIYYDLAKERERLGADDIAIIRMERLYPLPTEELAKALAPFEGAQVLWVQDEPENQGAWPFMALNLFPSLGMVPVGSSTADSVLVPQLRTVRVISREAAAAPATGLGWKHTEQAQILLEKAFH